MNWKTKVYLLITLLSLSSVVTILLRLSSGVLQVLAAGIGFSIFVALVGLGAYLWLIARQSLRERENKSAIISTPHGDYTIRRANRHLVRLTDSPYLDENGRNRPLTDDERWGWITRNISQPNRQDIIDVTPTTPLLPAAIFPLEIQLSSLVQRGDLSRLVIGVDITGQPVTISIHNLFHTIAAGSSGWGKSMFICAILDQMATAPSPVEMILIDQQDHGLSPFRNCPKLRYPLLRQPGEILSALREVYSEAVGLRSELFKAVDADNLEDYNQIADSPLPPIIVAVDEASALLSSDKDINTELKRQAWELRKFGVYQFLMLTSAKGTTLDTDHRQQFASKIQLHASDHYQARLLMNAKEATDFPKGRAMVDLPGLAPVIVQTPLVNRREIRSRWPVRPQPVIEIEPSEADKDNHFRRLMGEGYSKNAACLEVFGRKYAGDLVARSRRILGEVE